MCLFLHKLMNINSMIFIFWAVLMAVVSCYWPNSILHFVSLGCRYFIWRLFSVITWKFSVSVTHNFFCFICRMGRFHNLLKPTISYHLCECWLDTRWWKLIKYPFLKNKIFPNTWHSLVFLEELYNVEYL